MCQYIQNIATQSIQNLIRQQPFQQQRTQKKKETNQRKLCTIVEAKPSSHHV